MTAEPPSLVLALLPIRFSLALPRMNLVIRILVSCAVLSTVPILWRARRAGRSTTLTTARSWGMAAITVWVVVCGLTLATGTVSGPLSDHLWYAVSVLLLCPPIAVLGARRPGSRVWNWFVLAPLCLVLGWPAATSWNSQFEMAALFVETPLLLGHLLVLVMGVGNYLGTRYTPAALLFGSAMLMLLAPFYADYETLFSLPADRLRMTGSLLMAAAIWTAERVASSALPPPGFDRVWNDFRDSFGIVWARRIQDRINDTARKEKWPATLELHGFRWHESTSDSAAREAAHRQIEHTLRWLLRRFVDPVWVDERLRGSGRELHSAEREPGEGP